MAEKPREKANVAQLKARLSEYVRQVKGGGEVIITERGVIEPVTREAIAAMLST